MNIEGLRGPGEKVGGLVYFGRMVDKIRLHQAGKLPADYHENLGTAFDGRCVKYLGVTYPALVDRVKQGGSDEQILDWCFTQGRKPDEDETLIWNNFLSKRGWRDEASDILQQRKQKYNVMARDDIQTFFDIIDFDEGRK